ncbi:MAG: glycosyltransferase [Syntrophaceae bacterium]
MNNTLDPLNGGGTAERTLQVSRFLAELGADCTVLALDTGVTDDVRKRAGRARIVTLPCRVERYFVPSMSWNTLSNLVLATDVIQMMNHWTLLNAMVFHYARRYRKPYVVCPAGALPIFGRSKVLKGLYEMIVGRRIVREASACVAVSSNEIPDLKAHGALEEMISIIPNGIDPGDYVHADDQGFRRRYRLPDVPFILFVGRLNRIKGPDLLLDAFIRVVRARGIPHHLVFAGPDSGMLGELQVTSVREGVEKRIHFLGYVGDEDKSCAYHAADFLVIPSRQEAMSIVVLEAGIAGTPVLLTDQCGFDDVATVVGGMVVTASVEGLQEGLTVMTSDTAELRIMGENLEHFVRHHFLWDRTAKEYLELFRRIIH